MEKVVTSFNLTSSIKRACFITGMLLALLGTGIMLLIHSTLHPSKSIELFLVILIICIFFIPLLYITFTARIKLEKDGFSFSWILYYRINYSEIFRMGYGIQKDQKFGIHLLTSVQTIPLRIQHSRGILVIPINYFENYLQIISNLQKITGLAVENPATF